MTALRFRLAKNLVFYERLRFINNKQLAKKAGVSEEVITKYRNAKTKEPDLKILRKIAKALEVTVSDLLKED